MFPTWPQPILAVLLATTCGLRALPPAHAEPAPVAEQSAANTSATKNIEPQWVKLADGQLLLPVPGDWQAVKPRSRIIQHEFSIAAVKADQTPGRMTIMSAGGGVAANIERWSGQFQTSAGKPLGDDAKKVEKKKVGALEVHVVDLSGDFQDSPRGPFGPKVNRPGYRMLAVIFRLEKGGTWFVKSYGPEATMNAAEEAFATMVEGVKYDQQ